MSGWRGQGGRRSKGRRGGQDPELDNTAWLAELEREAAQADQDDEDDWASTLRGRRAPGEPPAPPAPPPAARPPSAPPPAAEPSWMPPADPAPPAADYRLLGTEPERAAPNGWEPDPAPRDPPAADPGWSSWRSQDPSYYDDPGPRHADPGPSSYDDPGPARADPWAGLGDPGADRYDPGGTGSDPYFGATGTEPAGEGWRSAGADTPTGAWAPEQPVGREPDPPGGAWGPAEPAGREPDYPALFGELYRRSAAQQDPIGEAPPAAEPLPDPGQPEPPSAWPFEETTQTWEPSDRSFVWPSDELPSTSTEWDRPAGSSWLDEPGPRATTPTFDEPPSQRPTPPSGDRTAAWSPPEPSAWAPPEPSAWAPPPAPGNGVQPPAAPPPADWAAAIPTDVPAARRVVDQQAATRAWRPDEAVDAEPAVPLGAPTRAPTGRAARPAAEPAELWPDEEPSDTGRAGRAGDRPARTWPRVVAVISWIVLVMVLCWYYVFPWLERMLPENF
jgi:hypothetical protein